MQWNPMLCESHKRPPRGEGWAFEIKWDGARASLYKDKGGRVHIDSRTKKSMTGAFPELWLDEVIKETDVFLDGEIVCFNSDGYPDYQLLQKRIHVTDSTKARLLSGQYPATFIPFDCLYSNGVDWRKESYKDRRYVLGGFTFGKRAYCAPHSEDGAAMMTIAERFDLEGIIAKKLNSTYTAGRSLRWLKIKRKKSEEFVIFGYEYGSGSRANMIGALYLGEYQVIDGKTILKSIGQVGTGFTEKELARLKLKLDTLIIDRSATGTFVECKPQLICEVEYLNRSNGGLLRQPAYKGERTDKTVEDLKPLSV